MISEISEGFTPLSRARLRWWGSSIVWLRAIKAAMVTMLRSRGVSPGRFQSWPRAVCEYFSRARPTILLPLDFCFGFVASHLFCARDEKERRDHIDEFHT